MTTVPPGGLPGPLVDGRWLADALADPVTAPAVADVRWYLDGRSGRRAWEDGHIPGAVWVDVDTVLSAPPGPGTGRHPLPDPEAFVAALARLGLVAERPVVAYDDAGGSIAARLWWMLSILGWDVAVLDGGLASWPGGLDRSEAPTDRPATDAVDEGRVWPSRRIADTAVVAYGAGSGTVVLDARSAARFAGEPNPADPRPGHIPGARSAPWTANLDPGTGRFLPADDLRRRFASLGVGDGAPVVSSCGSGVTACHNLLALHLAGLDGEARLYPGSWSAWAADPSLPVETGPDRP